MEQFIVSALKYRPQTFIDVVGQQAITNTVSNKMNFKSFVQTKNIVRVLKDKRKLKHYKKPLLQPSSHLLMANI